MTQAFDGALIGGRYRLIRRVGQGGMGAVWQARDETLERVVALKQLALEPGIAAEERARQIERVKREARMAARLDHPGIVRIHDVIDWGGSPGIVMEFLQGPSLGARLREREKLPVEETARLGAGLLAALRHAHGAGVVHRDLKPDNIMITETRTVITDFGIARPFDGTTALTMPSAIVGTPAFMAPEQIEGKKVTAASDLWSLGVTLYVAVEGALPFNGQTLGELCAAVLTRPMPAPRNAGALTPLLRALLAKDPSARPTTDAAIRLLAAADCSAASATWAQGRSGAVTAGPPSARTLPDRAAPLTEAMGVQPVRGRYVNFCLFSGHSMVWACP